MNSEVFSRNLRRLRLQKELTQERLAGILGVSVQTVSRIERSCISTPEMPCGNLSTTRRLSATGKMLCP